MSVFEKPSPDAQVPGGRAPGLGFPGDVDLGAHDAVVRQLVHVLAPQRSRLFCRDNANALTHCCPTEHFFPQCKNFDFNFRRDHQKNFL